MQVKIKKITSNLIIVYIIHFLLIIHFFAASTPEIVPQETAEATKENILPAMTVPKDAKNPPPSMDTSETAWETDFSDLDINSLFSDVDFFDM